MNLKSSKAIQLICLIAVGLIIFNLFYLGAKPIAVGLIPAPYDKLVHFALFATITMLIWIGTAGRFPLIALFCVVTIGTLDEIHQLYLPGRSAGLDDLLADAIGAVIMTLLLIKYNKPKKLKPTL